MKSEIRESEYEALLKIPRRGSFKDWYAAAIGGDAMWTNGFIIFSPRQNSYFCFKVSLFLHHDEPKSLQIEI